MFSRPVSFSGNTPAWNYSPSPDHSRIALQRYYILLVPANFGMRFAGKSARNSALFAGPLFPLSRRGVSAERKAESISHARGRFFAILRLRRVFLARIRGIYTDLLGCRIRANPRYHCPKTDRTVTVLQCYSSQEGYHNADFISIYYIYYNIYNI